MINLSQRMWFAGAAVLLAICVCLAAECKAAANTQPTRTALSSPPHVVAMTDVKYGEARGRSNLLDVYIPDHVSQALPLVIWIHGGGWARGDKSPCPALPLLSRGYIAASINYRLTNVAPYPAQIEDCKGAIRYLRAHAADYHIDPERIGVWGASAGGHLVALLGTSAGIHEIEGTVGGNLEQSSRVQAVCDWFGPTDLSKFADEALAAGMVNLHVGPPLITALLGGPIAAKKDVVRKANPISFISPEHAKEIPPFLIMHGDKDNLVPIAQSQLLADALKAAEVPVDFKTVEGAGHGIGFNRASIGIDVIKFFDSTLKRVARQ